MKINVDKKDLAEKIIEAEIQKQGEYLENSMPEGSLSEAGISEISREEMDQEFQDILRKRAAYQLEQERKVLDIQKEDLQNKRRRFSSAVKAAVVVLVAGTCLFAFSMQSEATRMWWLESVERIIGGERGNRVNNDENRIISEVNIETAIGDIEEQTGIPMPEFQYEPKGMIFDGYDYDENIARGALYYLYDEYVITLDAYSVDDDSSYALNYDGTITAEKMVNTAFAEVKLVEISNEKDAESDVLAEWTYHNHQYRIFGKLPMAELEKIIENIFY